MSSKEKGEQPGEGRQVGEAASPGRGVAAAAAARLIEVPRCQVAAVGVAVEIVVSGLPAN